MPERLVSLTKTMVWESVSHVISQRLFIDGVIGP